MSDATITVVWTDPGPTYKVQISIAPNPGIWIDYRAQPGGDGSWENPFSSIEEAFGEDFGKEKSSSPFSDE